MIATLPINGFFFLMFTFRVEMGLDLLIALSPLTTKAWSFEKDDRGLEFAGQNYLGFYMDLLKGR